LLTGQPPASAALRDRIPLVNLREVRPQLSPALERAILQGLELSLDRRSPSIEAWMNPLWREFCAILPDLTPIEAPPEKPSPSSENLAETDFLPSPLLEVTATADRETDRAISESSLPPQLQPWIPALFVATSAIAGIGGASFVFARQSNVATPPAPEFSRLQEAFPSRSAQSNFGPDRAFVEAADPESTSDSQSSPSVPSEAATLETEGSGESATMPVGTPVETTPAVEFPIEVESLPSTDGMPTNVVTTPDEPESDRLSENYPPAPDRSQQEWNGEQYRQFRSPSAEPQAEPQAEPVPMETIPSAPPLEIPEYPDENRAKPPMEAYFIPKSSGEFSAPKQSKPRTETLETGASTYWSNTMPL
jgi:hypothetical protein